MEIGPTRDLDEASARGASNLLASSSHQATNRGDVLGARFDQRATSAQLEPELSSWLRQQVCCRNASALYRVCENLSVDAVGFSTMLADAELPNTRRVDEQHLVAPAAQNVVDVPGLAARFDG